MHIVDFILSQKQIRNLKNRKLSTNTQNLTNKSKNSIQSQFQTGTYIGHKSINLSKKKYWHPLMSDFLLGIRHKIAIFNPYSLQKNILQACDVDGSNCNESLVSCCCCFSILIEFRINNK